MVWKYLFSAPSIGRHGVYVRTGGADDGEDLPDAAPWRERTRARYLRRARRAHRHR